MRLHSDPPRNKPKSAARLAAEAAFSSSPSRPELFDRGPPGPHPGIGPVVTVISRKQAVLPGDESARFADMPALMVRTEIAPVADVHKPPRVFLVPTAPLSATVDSASSNVTADDSYAHQHAPLARRRRRLSGPVSIVYAAPHIAMVEDDDIDAPTATDEASAASSTQGLRDAMAQLDASFAAIRQARAFEIDSPHAAAQWQRIHDRATALSAELKALAPLIVRG